MRLPCLSPILVSLAVCGCGSSASPGDAGAPLNVAGTWTGTYDQATSNGGSPTNRSVTVTLTVTQAGDTVSYAGTLTNGAVWACPDGTLDGDTIRFPSCTVTYSTCTATVTDRKDVIDDTATPWTMSPSYSYTWSGSCIAGGYTVKVPASGETAVLTRE